MQPETGHVCGVDEAGRGPLAGAVYAAAVILDPKHPIAGLRDSKKLSERNRILLAAEIRTHALAWSVAFATVEEIEQLNILHASMLAMRRAVLALHPAARAIIKGDDSEACISAASILAKTERDQEMRRLADTYPMYGFERHAGYPTAAHLAALAEHGPSPVHRKTFGPVQRSCLRFSACESGVPLAGTKNPESNSRG
jgi:ribonuclease HII